MKLTKLKADKGFTLVEILVVVAITVLLSSLAISYNRSGEKQIILFRDQALVVGLLNRTKSLAIQKYRDPSISGDYLTCAFGLHFEPGSRDIILFQDLNEDDNCDSAIYGYDLTEGIETFSLNSRLEFSGIPVGGLDILFVPPELSVITAPPDRLPVTITIQTIDGSLITSITISTAGQIVTE